MDLNGQKALLLGALGRAGTAVARKFCEEGASVVLSARREDEGAHLTAELRDAGFAHFIVDAGGDLVLSGSRGGTPWNIGVRHPRSVQLLATARLAGCAIATSGDYEQYFVADGVRYGHIIDPRTGWPTREVASVVVVAPRGADADALATGLFVLGPDQGLALVEKITSVDALFVMGDGDVHSSTGLSLQGDTMEWIE